METASSYFGLACSVALAAEACDMHQMVEGAVTEAVFGADLTAAGVASVAARLVVVSVVAFAAFPSCAAHELCLMESSGAQPGQAVKGDEVVAIS